MTSDPRIKATKVFQKFTSEQRAIHAASHRLGYRQRQAVGESFWVNGIDSIAHKTRKAAIHAAERYYAHLDSQKLIAA